MPTDAEILDDLDQETVEQIEKLAGGNMSPSDIARRLSINRKDFLRVWRMEGSGIREA